MKLQQRKLFALFLVITLTGTVHLKAQTREEIDKLQAETEADLTGNLLTFWIDHAVDPEGGFYGTIMEDGTPALQRQSLTDKGSILNGRILWTFASAYRVYGLESYRMMADRAARYYLDHFVDRKYGGVYWTVNAEGVVNDDTKQSYATAFGIYGLSEYFRATGNRESLDAAISLYRTLESHAHDRVNKGYFEVFSRDYSTTDEKGVDGEKGASKTMNSHIHIMEAYTNLYRVWPDESLRENIIELIDILGNRLYSQKTNHLVLYCQDDWTQFEGPDSYGHDIETAWLLCESAKIVGDDDLIRKTQTQALKMTDTVLKEALQDDGNLVYERTPGGKISIKKSWWPQCEAIVGFINAWQITSDAKYFKAAAKVWDYTKKHYVDQVNGGWHTLLTDDGQPTNEPKGSLWNCPYHNSRMGFELKERLRHNTVHSEVMAWSNMTGIRLEGELIDFESFLGVGTIGGQMEKSGRELQKNIRYTREGDRQTTITPMHGTTITQSVTDVDAGSVECEWNCEATETLDESAYFCMSFSPRYYSNARISSRGKVVTVDSKDRQIRMVFDRSVKTYVKEENGEKVLYVTLMPKLVSGEKSQLKALIKVDGSRHHETMDIALMPEQTGRQFAGFGGNFRIQNVRKDPQVIDYCLNNLRVAFGRVEMPWSTWDQQGETADHVIRSASMARQLKAQNMPLIVSCWFPPEWAGTRTTRSDGTSRAYSLKPEEKEHIFESLTSYLLFLKNKYGAEADYFSFNESDLGIDIVHTPQEHCDFIKEFGQYMAENGLKTKLLLGDNSDATTFDFIVPALNDKDAHKYIGAISFHSWRGCDDATLAKWAAASRQINVPLIIGEGSTDAAAHQYPGIFNESTFALYEINLYTRLCAQCQPLSILQWQLTSDYSLMWGDGIYGSDGPMRPTQRFYNIRQLSLTPANSFAIPAECPAEDINIAAFSKPSTGEYTMHAVNNAASRMAHITGIPEGVTQALVYVTNAHQNAEALMLQVKDGVLDVMMPAESFVSVFTW